MNNLKIEGKEIPYDVTESDKATLARIDINPSGVKVVVPKGSGIDPHKFVEERQEWVLKNYEQIQDILAEFPEREFKEGETFPYMGEEREIVYSDIERTEVKNGEIHLPEEDILDKSVDSVLEGFLREKAREQIHEVIEKYIDKVEGDYNRVYIRNQKTKWGSCSGKKNLSFNFRLIMAPPEVLEYVVVHELVHLEKPEHSKEFWGKLSNLLPDYQDRKKWLKENKMNLVFTEKDVF